MIPDDSRDLLRVVEQDANALLSSPEGRPGWKAYWPPDMLLDELTLPLHVEQQPGRGTLFLRIPSIYVWGYLTSLSARARVGTLLREQLSRMTLDVPLDRAAAVMPDESPPPPENAGPT